MTKVKTAHERTKKESEMINDFQQLFLLDLIANWHKRIDSVTRYIPINDRVALH